MPFNDDATVVDWKSKEVKAFYQGVEKCYSHSGTKHKCLKCEQSAVPLPESSPESSPSGDFSATADSPSQKKNFKSHISQPADPIIFHGVSSILSNFSVLEEPIIGNDGTRFSTAEHMYQAQKAHFHGRFDLLSPIISAKTAAIAKSHGKKVKSSPRWNFLKKPVMYEILHLKSQVSPSFRKALKFSKRKPLFHSCPYNGAEKFWSTSLTPEDTSQSGGIFPGRNVFGQLLEALRAHLFSAGALDFFSPPRSSVATNPQSPQHVLIRKSRPAVTCLVCGVPGHTQNECRHATTYPNGVPCYGCGLLGHMKSRCKNFRFQHFQSQPPQLLSLSPQPLFPVPDTTSGPTQ